MRRLDLGGRAGALVGVRRRQPDVEHDDVGFVFADQVGEALRATVGADDVVTSVPEQAGETFAQQDLVLDQRHPHGSSAVSRVPVASLRTTSWPPTACTRSASPASPDPGRGAAPPTPSSATVTIRLPFRRTALKVAADARACLMTLVSPSQPTKKAVASICRSSRSAGTSMVIGSGARPASSW